jgi:hypothetical protein
MRATRSDWSLCNSCGIGTDEATLLLHCGNFCCIRWIWRRFAAVAEQYAIDPQTLRLYEREGLLAPSRSEGNTRLYTDDDLERLEVILKLTRELGVNLAGGGDHPQYAREDGSHAEAD